MLADAGADVIKVEPPTGDETRYWGPHYLDNCVPEDGYPGDSAYYTCCNRNKRSIAINLGSSDGQEIVRRLLSGADVVIENFKPGTMERWGLGYESTLRSLNDRLVYVNISGFGKDGPDAGLPGYDFVVQAAAGLMSVTGEVGGAPMKVGVAVTDLATGVTAAFAIAAALVQRGITGRGQRVDTSLLGTQVSWLANVGSSYLISKIQPRRYGNAHANVVPYELFQAADRHMVIAVGNDQQFARCADVLGHPEWAMDPRFQTNVARVEHRDELISVLQGLLRQRPATEWIKLFRGRGIPVSAVRTVDEVLSDAQVRHLGLIGTYEHPAAGIQECIASPIAFDSMVNENLGPPPMFSEHAEEILKDLGYDRHELESLTAAAAVVIPVGAKFPERSGSR